jgi:hypothetical protein
MAADASHGLISPHSRDRAREDGPSDPTAAVTICRLVISTASPKEETMRQPRPPEDDRRSRRDRNDHEHEHRRDHDRDDSGDDPRRQELIIERRWLGSIPPTAELYARALRQWEALPGAVVRSAADVPPMPAPKPPPSSSATSEKGPEEGEQ